MDNWLELNGALYNLDNIAYISKADIHGSFYIMWMLCQPQKECHTAFQSKEERDLVFDRISEILNVKVMLNDAKDDAQQVSHT